MIKCLLCSVLFFLVVLLFTATGACIKEYSYERSPIDTVNTRDSTQVGDTTNNRPSLVLSQCKSCQQNSPLAVSQWSFSIGNDYFCGDVTGAVLSPDGAAMTFFGPTPCTIDTGLVITAYFTDRALKEDRQNISANRALLEYYDNTTHTNVLESSRSVVFRLTITNYIHQTGEASGTFSGSVLAKNGSIVVINNGRFRVQFR